MVRNNNMTFNIFESIYNNSTDLKKSNDEMQELIKKVNDALHKWASDKQVFASKEENHNAAEFELTCDNKGDGTYISITVPKTLGYFPLNKSLLDFIDLLDSDETLNSLKNDDSQDWTLYTGQSAATEHNWKDKDCIEIALCSIPGIWSDPNSNEVQKDFLERVLSIISDTSLNESTLNYLREASKERFLKPWYDDLSYDEDSRLDIMYKTNFAQKPLPQYEELIKFIDSGAIGNTKIDWQKLLHYDREHWSDDKYFESGITEIAKIVDAYYTWKNKGGSRKERHIAKKMDANKVFFDTGLIGSIAGIPMSHCDFVMLPELENDKFIFVMPMTWEACKWMDSAKCGGQTAKWCIGTKDTKQYWKQYINKYNLFILAFSKDANPEINNRKWMIQIETLYSGSPLDAYENGAWKAWNQDDDVSHCIEPRLFKEVFGWNIRELARQALNVVKENPDCDYNKAFYNLPDYGEAHLWDDLYNFYFPENIVDKLNYSVLNMADIESWTREDLKKSFSSRDDESLVFNFNNCYIPPEKCHAGNNGYFDIPTFVKYIKDILGQEYSNNIKTLVFLKGKFNELRINPSEMEDLSELNYKFQDCSIRTLLYDAYKNGNIPSRVQYDFSYNCDIECVKYPCTEAEFNKIDTRICDLPCEYICYEWEEPNT